MDDFPFGIHVFCGRNRQNPGYMKENFMICIESLHIADTGEQDNVRCLSKFLTFNVVLMLMSFQKACKNVVDLSINNL